ncbi:putative FAD binding domain protein [Rosellinia necatrix]|uniref:Delta(24)-sterol reductase n=1 Tax=Rosellinia necatrix TaxID=77044 RepID=A0A1W2TKP9_ROSNE|nr:putative FAD binding domain protein [Rosellinia necatrix]
MEAHNEAVAAISKRLQEFYARGAAFRVYHGSTNSTRAIHKDADSVVDTSGLNRVLGVDRARKTALVEPNVPMDALVAATLEAGLVPLVVMEFPGITAGGGFSGSAGESSSGRHGPFDATVDEIEIVVPDGAVLRASPRGGGGGGGAASGPRRRPDLFWGAASAFGTVGVVTLLEVRLRDAAPYVRLAHYPLASFADAARVLQERVADPAVEFVDGVAFSPAELVVCAGALADHLPPGVKPRRYLGRGDPWFYLDVRRRVMKKNKKKGKKGTGTGDAVVDYVPLTDYLFRWDRGGFWVARHAFRYFFTPFNRATRYALDRFMHARVMYHALHASALSDAYVIQDVGVPFAGAADFYAWVDATLGIRPVWLCPIRVRRGAGDADGDGGDAAHGLHASFADPDATPELLLNFGIWGPGPRDPAERLRLNRLLEREVHARGGNKTLYAQAFYTEDEFWRAYDRPAYDAVRRRYHADHLPSVYDKVVAKVDEGGVVKRHEAARSRMPAALRERRPFQGLYGVYKAWRGGDYLLRKKATAAGEPERAS